eukprot:4670378-Amphidinium_carterae.2
MANRSIQVLHHALQMQLLTSRFGNYVESRKRLLTTFAHTGRAYMLQVLTMDRAVGLSFHPHHKHSCSCTCSLWSVEQDSQYPAAEHFHQ